MPPLPDETYICKDCKKVFGLDEAEMFISTANGKSYVRRRCLKCRSAKQMARRKAKAAKSAEFREGLKRYQRMYRKRIKEKRMRELGL